MKPECAGSEHRPGDGVRLLPEANWEGSGGDPIPSVCPEARIATRGELDEQPSDKWEVRGILAWV